MPFVIRNTFIRIVGFLESFWNLLNQLFKPLFGRLAQLFGFTESNSGYYVEERNSTTDQQKKVGSSQAKSISSQSIPSQSTPAAKPVASSRSTTNRSGTEMDYFRNMARQIKK